MAKQGTKSGRGRVGRTKAGRTLVAFFIATAVLFGLVAIAGQWKPTLGLDLSGGTRVQLAAEGDVTSENLQEAAEIIDRRVNGSGVAEAEITTQGNRYVVGEIPGQSNSNLVDLMLQRAQLRFRLVACPSDTVQGCNQTGTTPGEGQSSFEPGSGVTVPPSNQPSGEASADPSGEPSGSATSTPRNRPLPGFAETASPSASPSASEGASPSDGDSAPAPSANASASPGADPSSSGPAEPKYDAATQKLIDKPLEWVDAPDEQSLQEYANFTCPAGGRAPQVTDTSNEPLVTCDENGQKYLLSQAVIEGTQVNDTSFGIPQQQTQYAVTLDLDGKGADTMREVSQQFYPTGQQFAITLDGQVLSAPNFQGVINDGSSQITGDFTQAEARDLSTSLKFGSLPVKFEPDPTVEDIGPTLAGNQLSAGITAGIIGLILVMGYCLLYYRGLGMVVIASLFVAAAWTYALVMLLSKTAGFTLTLPGIAGLIIAVGITADSFIVYFERIRDEMRDGRSMRAAVEAGWARARNTCVVADMVSLLAAVVLFIFATGVVKGFAFALGLSTLIDLAVFFWFTHPLVSWLGRFAFFNKGHKLSGLDAENLGVDRLPGVPATTGAAR